MRSNSESRIPPNPTPTRRNGEETRRRILEAAQLLFAQQGLGATSLRAIARAAEVRQPSLHYHFRDKRELFRATMELRVVPLYRARLAALEELERQGDFDLRAVLSASQGPIIRAWQDRLAPGISIVNLLYRANVDGEPEWKELYEELVSPIRERYISAFERVLPALCRAELLERLSFTEGALAGLYLDRGESELSRSWRELHGDLEAFESRLVALCSSVLESPPLGPPPQPSDASKSDQHSGETQ